jgi:O-antigen/teichoic acid export membrane protein
MIFNIICVVFLKWDVNGVLIATILSSFISIVYLIIKNHVRLNHFYNDIYIKLISYSAPLILNSVSWWIFNVSDRTLITIFLGASSNGVYSIANKFSGICTTIYGMFNMAWTETISKSIDDSDRDEFLSENINKITNIFFSIIIILIAFMPIIFRILINEKYNMAYLQIPILLVAAYYYCKSAIIGAVYIALKDTKEIAATSMGAAVLNLLINVLFINEIGLYAASFSTLISYFILYMYRFIKLKKKIGVKYMPIDALAKIIVLVICLSLYYTNTGVSNIINIMFSVIVTSVFLNKLQ